MPKRLRIGQSPNFTRICSLAWPPPGRFREEKSLRVVLPVFFQVTLQHPYCVGRHRNRRTGFLRFQFTQLPSTGSSACILGCTRLRSKSTRSATRSPSNSPALRPVAQAKRKQCFVGFASFLDNSLYILSFEVDRFLGLPLTRQCDRSERDIRDADSTLLSVIQNA